MKVTAVKNEFGPWSIKASLEFDPKSPVNPDEPKGKTRQQHYLELGVLHELERKGASEAEKPFWFQKNSKGEFVRGTGPTGFSRNKHIPATVEARARIMEILVQAGYIDVEVSLRGQTIAQPAYKQRAKYLGELHRDGVVNLEIFQAQLAKLATETGVELAVVTEAAKA